MAATGEVWVSVCSLGNLYLLVGQCLKKIRHQNILLGVMTQRKPRVYTIDVSPTDFTTLDVPSQLKVGDDLVRRAFGHPYVVSDLPRGGSGVVE